MTLGIVVSFPQLQPTEFQGQLFERLDLKLKRLMATSHMFENKSPLVLTHSHVAEVRIDDHLVRLPRVLVENTPQDARREGRPPAKMSALPKSPVKPDRLQLWHGVGQHESPPCSGPQVLCEA